MINMFSSSADVSSVLLIFTLCELFLYRSKYMLYYHLFYASKIDDFIFRKRLFWILFGIGLWPSYYLSWEARDQCTFQEVAGYRVGWTSIPKGRISNSAWVFMLIGCSFRDSEIIYAMFSHFTDNWLNNLGKDVNISNA